MKTAFPGGIHLPDHKAESCTTPIAAMPLLQRYVVPLSQHIGAAAVPVVKVGDAVLRGQMIARRDGALSCAAHAPTSGVVSAIEVRPMPHPSGLWDLCIVIESDGADAPVAWQPIDWENLPPEAVREQLADRGLAGLGGAVFPSHIKLDPANDGHWPVLVLNGAECEPWITCDDRLMRERATDVLQGARVMQRLIGAAEILVGIEDNKPEAIAAMQSAASPWDDIHIIAVPAVYPMGGGKQLAQQLTGRVTPSGGRTTDVGVQVFNVGTAAALWQAVSQGEPLICRIVSVTGAVERPGNFDVRIGTPINDLITAVGGVREDAAGTLVGGPMMGFLLHDEAATVSKAVNCVLVRPQADFPPRPRALPCIRCSRCAAACPVSLQPFEMYWYARAKDFGKAQSYSLFDCIECGCCSFVCPSAIPLVEFFRYAKGEIWAREQEKGAADQARERHEFREFRLEREKQEKAEKHAKAAAAAKQGASPEDADAARKKAILDAAMARASKARETASPKNTTDLPTDKQQEILEIEMRRAQLKQAVDHQISDIDADAREAEENNG